MTGARQTFGGSWTTEKLERVRQYLVAYAKIMSKRHFRFAYIDAFAGTGYRMPKQEEGQLALDELSDVESQTFLQGSARIALQVNPRFTKYIFIELNESRFSELQRLKSDFPLLAQDIILVNADANAYIKDLCQNYNWDRNRAVLFLDPFGMQVGWDTISAIAQTEAIDLWWLFPLGVAVNRLLTRTGDINEGWVRSLDANFGTHDWFDAFYRVTVTRGLFGEQSALSKVATFDSIIEFFVERLRTVFAGVAENPLVLYNSRSNPLYLLCFASGNPKGAPTALRIAQSILRG